jgi:hypothetical protein
MRASLYEERAYDGVLFRRVKGEEVIFKRLDRERLVAASSKLPGLQI